MLEGKAVIGETYMLQTMQEDAVKLAAQALDSFDVIDSTHIACFIKKANCFSTLSQRCSITPRIAQREF
ncbi:hypothetical protein AMTR_s00003p00270190 [Amborella trichopoda]|uniref:Uncharacterized protein n=1 Tax=Amborella trichopoda TaxID=13333 RepID=W1P7D4_AMBTC|nr:hypothetical protein AMTR_s00003p00270190 [Amborella trichopoda]